MKEKLVHFMVAALVVISTGMAAKTVEFRATPIRTDPFPAQSGERVELNFKVSNIGSSSAENVSLRFQEQGCFSLVAGEKDVEKLGDMFPGETYYLSKELKVDENCPDGKAKFNMKFIRNGVTVSDSMELSVVSESPELNLGDIDTSPTELYPDSEDNKMTLEVVNNGEETAENVVGEISLPEGFEKVSSLSVREAVGNIAPGGVKRLEFRFDLDQNASKGDREIPLNLSFTEGEERKFSNSSFSVYVSGKPLYRIEKVEANLSKEKRKGLRLTVKNIGDEKSESTRVRLLDSSDLPVSVESASSYIGTLEPGETGEAYFSAKLEEDAEKRFHLLDFEVRGVKSSNVFVEQETVRVSGSTGKDTRGVPMSTILLVSAGVLVSSGVFFRKRLSGLL